MHFETEINLTATKALTHHKLVFNIILFCLTLVGFSAYLSIATIYDLAEEIYFIPVLVVFILLFILSAFYIFVIYVSRKRARDNRMNFHYIFNNDHVLVTHFEGDKKSTIRIDYSSIKFYKEVRNYYFLYLDARNVFPIEKKEGIEEIKRIINISSIARKHI